MNIQGIRSNEVYKTLDEAQETKKQEADTLNASDKKQETVKEQKMDCDEYIPGNKEKKRPSGIYSLAKDEAGNPIIQYDDPSKKTADNNKQNKTSDEDKENDIKNSEKSTTANTDQVDREIESLKKEKEQLTKQIKSMTDPDKIKALESKLKQIENELQQKDNEAYRYQNAVIS